MADGVNTAMKAVQALGIDAAATSALPDAAALELLERHHTVLIGRNPGNEGVRIGVGEFPSHGGR